MRNKKSTSFHCNYKNFSPNMWTTEIGWIKGDIRVSKEIVKIHATTKAKAGPAIMAYQHNIWIITDLHVNFL